MTRVRARAGHAVHQATVTSKRQLTIPAQVFSLMGLRTGDKVRFEPSADGAVEITAVPQTDVLGLAGRFESARGVAADGDLHVLRRTAYRKRARELDARLRTR